MTPVTATATRFHIGLHTSDLDRAVRFYRLLLGAGPTKSLDDYAKFELDEPPLVLALYPSPRPPGGALNHVGLRLPDSPRLVAVQQRLEEAGIATQRQEGVECCYARQTKFWVTDPDKVLWEIYTLHEDIEHSGFEDPPISPDAVPAAIWEHRITDPLPARIEVADGSLDEVRLEGTFNALVPAEALARLLAEAYRALRPGGTIAVHGLVGDKPFPGKPNLPGMAALVQRVPVETEPLDALEKAGFAALAYEKLGDIHCFHVGGVELRELRLVGRKLLSGSAGVSPSRFQRVLYKGPFEQVTTEDGIIFSRGVAVRLAGDKIAQLSQGPLAGCFVVLEEGASCGC
jgi:catechol 2,3-dioxygenase-like lactoylglutathione lyase family enzyme